MCINFCWSKVFGISHSSHKVGQRKEILRFDTFSDDHLPFVLILLSFCSSMKIKAAISRFFSNSAIWLCVISDRVQLNMNCRINRWETCVARTCAWVVRFRSTWFYHLWIRVHKSLIILAVNINDLSPFPLSASVSMSSDLHPAILSSPPHCPSIPILAVELTEFCFAAREALCVSCFWETEGIWRELVVRSKIYLGVCIDFFLQCFLPFMGINHLLCFYMYLILPWPCIFWTPRLLVFSLVALHIWKKKLTNCLAK